MYKVWSVVKLACLLSLPGGLSIAMAAHAPCASLFSHSSDFGFIPSVKLGFNFLPREIGRTFFKKGASQSAWTNRLHDKNVLYEVLLSDPHTEIQMIEGFQFSYGVRESFRKTVDKGEYFIETIDTLVRDNEWWGEARGPERTAFASEMQNAKEIRKKWLDEIADVVLADYIVRRGWSPEFVQAMRKKIHATANSTRYEVYRIKNPDGTKGEIVGVIGLQRAPYGTVTFYNIKSGQWERRTGAFGPSYDSLYDSNFNLSAESIKKWGSAVSLLGAEVYLGKKLPRPSAIYKIDQPGTARTPSERLTDDIEVDTTKPIYYGMGEILEPVRFYLNKRSIKRKEVRRQLSRDFLISIFPAGVDANYLAHGQFLYTYNTAEGIRLYHKGQGFRILEGDQANEKDGSSWSTLGVSPAEFIRAMKSQLGDTMDQSLEELVSFMTKNTADKEFH